MLEIAKVGKDGQETEIFLGNIDKVDEVSRPSLDVRVRNQDSGVDLVELEEDGNCKAFVEELNQLEENGLQLESVD